MGQKPHSVAVAATVGVVLSGAQHSTEGEPGTVLSWGGNQDDSTCL